MTPCLRRQRGAALIVSLIMLLLITLLAISSFTVGKSNLQIVGNMQQRAQALSAAQSTIATVISSIQFTLTPADAIRNACGGGSCVDGNVVIDCNGANTACVDNNGDGIADVNVTVGVTCDSIQPIPLECARPHQDAGPELYGEHPAGQCRRAGCHEQQFDVQRHRVGRTGLRY